MAPGSLQFLLHSLTINKFQITSIFASISISRKIQIINYLIVNENTVRQTNTDATNEAARKLQIALNDAMRISTRTLRRDHVKIADLVERSGMKTFNRMVAEDMLMLTWSAINDKRSPLANVIKKKTVESDARASRSMSRGDIVSGAVTTRGQKNFPEPAIRLWNSSSTVVRAATTKQAAKRAISKFALSLPL